SLTERNNLAKGAVEVATNTAEYVENVASGKKSWQDVAQDAGEAAVSIGTGLYNDYIDPFVKDEKYKQDNLHGGLWTRSVDESYAKGQNEFKKDMVVAEAVLTVYSGGMGTAALKGGKSVAKLDVDAPHCKQPHADMDADGGKGRGGLLHRSGVDDLLEGTPLKDGKLKTKAKLFDDVLKDFDLLTEKYQHNMLKQIFEKIRIKAMVELMTGQGSGKPTKHVGYHDWDNQTSHAGLPDKKGTEAKLATSLNPAFSKRNTEPHASGTQAVQANKLPDKNTPNENVLPKVANGDTWYSNYSSVKKNDGGGTSKGNLPEKDKPNAGGTGNVVTRAQKIDLATSVLRDQLDKHIDFIKKGGLRKPLIAPNIGGGKYVPKVVTAAIDIEVPDIVHFGYNGRREGQFNPSVKELHEDLEKLINKIKERAKNDPNNEYRSKESYEDWDVENCAEVQAVNLALHNGAKMENILIRTVYGNSGELKDLCNNCNKTFENFLIDLINLKGE
ncbi:hypothetical protein ABES04_26565, partial [Brevibacillus parabrevis]